MFVQADESGGVIEGDLRRPAVVQSQLIDGNRQVADVWRADESDDAQGTVVPDEDTL